MKLGDIPFTGYYMVYMRFGDSWNKVHTGCGRCPDEFNECYVQRVYPYDDAVIVEVSAPENPRGMYVVKVNNGIEKHFTRCQNARRAAAKIANDGRVYIDNPEMNMEQRWETVHSVRIYDMRCPHKDIDF